MACTFIEELSKLRKLSMESVENTASFAPFKQYLHVVRPVEDELRTLLRRVNRENKKCLVMLCGSAGDKAIVSTRDILNLLYDIIASCINLFA